ncbi:MAG: glycosyltransferase [Gammaproteobacteria bacterium]|nr:glycosyltransferase [Gammaproteobacteria bacterium]
MSHSKIESQYKKMKVVHSFPVWLPQTQTWMYSQVKQMQRLGVEAHVVCERTENLDQFSVENLHCLEYESRFRQVWDKGLRKLRVRRYLNYLVKISRKSGTNIIHSHFGNVGWANLGAIRKLKAKHVVTFYGLDVNKLPMQRPVWRERYRQLFSEVDLVLCEGSHMAECVVRLLGCPSHKVKVQHLGVDVDSILFQPRSWCIDEPLKVLIAASFREKKGIPYAIKALQVVARKIPIQLTIIGDAGQDLESHREKEFILSELEHSGLKEHTRLLGYQTHQSMLKEAYNHHFFLQPSVTAKDGDTEGGAPVSIIEMLATGMPVVATTHCDIPEVVGSAFANFLAPERDVKKLAECIHSLISKSDDWLSLTKEGRKHIESEYHQVRQAEHLADYYNEISK